MAAKLRVAVLDLGSTSFHLLVGDAKPSGEIHRVASSREMLRLGATIADSRRIPKEVCQRAIDTARALWRESEAYEADRVVVVATAALRDAKNGAALASSIEKAIGNPVRVLSGEEEARLIFAAFRHVRPFADDEVVLGADLGGGSLELAVGDQFEVAWEATLELGVARLQREIVKSDPMRKREIREIRRRVRDDLAPHLPEIERRGAARCIASGGTVRALWSLIAADRTRRARDRDALHISFRELEQIRERLVKASHEERLEIRGIKLKRADLLPTGALVLEQLAKSLDLDGLTVSDWGLREGLILEALGLADASAPKRR